MRRVMLHGKIHRATVTGASVDYIGSITLDAELMEAAGILPHEQVHVLNIDYGARFETYAIEGERGSGQVSSTGATAHLVTPSDRVIILAYAQLDEEEAQRYKPRLVLVDDRNRPIVQSSNGAEESVAEPETCEGTRTHRLR